MMEISMDVESKKSWPYWSMEKKLMAAEHRIGLLQLALLAAGVVIVVLLTRGCQAAPDLFGAEQQGAGSREQVAGQFFIKSRSPLPVRRSPLTTTEADARRGAEGRSLLSQPPARSDCFEQQGAGSRKQGAGKTSRSPLPVPRSLAIFSPRVAGHSMVRQSAIAPVGVLPTNRIDGRRRGCPSMVTPPPANGLKKRVAGSREPVAGWKKPATDYRPLTTTPFEITAYEPSPVSCGKWSDGFTASGLPVTYNGGRFVAADRRVLPFGSLVRIPGYANGQPVPVIDVGGAIRGKRIDVFFNTLQQARRWGRRKNVPVQIVRIGWGEEKIATKVTKATKVTREQVASRR